MWPMITCVEHSATLLLNTATLYGVSAFGSQICIYAFDTATVSLDPPAIARDLVVVNDSAPETGGAYDLLQPKGEAKL